MQISIVFPAFNEEKRILDSLRQVSEYCRNAFDDFEIIVVDDGSADRTSDVAESFTDADLKVLKNDTNQGKGFTVCRGILAAHYPLVLFSDSDLPVPIGTLDKFLQAIQSGADIVIASKYLPDSVALTPQPLSRRLMGKVFQSLVSLLVLPGFHDTQCGFKLLKTDVAKKIVSCVSMKGYTFDVEMLLLARKMGCNIKEIGVSWGHYGGSRVRLSVDPLKMLWEVLIIAYRNVTGVYTRKIQQ